MKEIFFLVIFLISFILVYILPGFFVLNFLKIRLKLAEKIALSIITSAAISSLFLYLAVLIIDWSVFKIWLLFIIFNGILYFLQRIFIGPITSKDNKDEDNLTASNPAHRRIIWLLAIILGIIFIFGAWEYKDSIGVFHTTVMGDNDKHFAITVSLMNSQKFPAEIATSALPHPVKVSYYYFFYLLIAALTEMTFRLVPMIYIFALVGGIIIASGSILLTLVAHSLFNGKRDGLFAAFLPFIAGFQIISLINYYLVKDKHLLFLTLNDDMGVLPIFTYPHAVGWMPQHLLALFFILLLIFILKNAKKQKLTWIFCGLLFLAVLPATSIFVFAGALFGVVIFLFYLIISKGIAKTLIPFVIGLFSFLIFFYFTSKAFLGGGDKEYVGNMLAFVLRDPLVKNEIFSQTLSTVDLAFWPRVWWLFLYFFERIGLVLPLGIIGIIYFRNLIREKIDLALLLFLGLGAIIATFLFGLPGEQNELSKYASLLYVLMFGFFTVGLIDKIYDWYQNFISDRQYFINFKWKRFLQRLSVDLVAVIFIIGLTLNFASGWWAYHWGIIFTKIKNSEDRPRNYVAGAALWIRKNTDKNDLISLHPQFSPLIVCYGERRVLANSKLGVFPVATERQRSELESIKSTLESFDRNGYNQAAYEYLKRYGVRYLVTAKFDSIFDKRYEKIDSSLFRSVYSDKDSTVYKLK